MNPIVGYANSYDFVRQSACIGVWQVYSGLPRGAALPERPVNNLIFDGDIRPDVCMHSSDNLFGTIAARCHKIGSRVDFRELAAWKMLALVSFTAAFLYKLSYGRIRLLFASMFLLIFGDIIYISYFNTLYLEYSVVASCFLAFAGTIFLACSPMDASPAMFALLLVSLAWLGLSKEQYVPLASILCIICAIIVLLRSRDFNRAKYFALLALGLPWLYGHMNSHKYSNMRAVSLANKTDTFLAEVLPKATSPARAVALLRLPPSCIAGIGKSWYDPGVQQHHPCPEIAGTPRLRLLKLFADDPATFMMPMSDATSKAVELYPAGLNNLEVPEIATDWRYRLVYWTSASTFLRLLPMAVLSAVTGLLMVVSPMAMGLAALMKSPRKVRREQRLALIMIGSGGILAFYTIASSVFGDGMFDVPKHAVMLLASLITASAGLVLLAIALF